MVCGGWVRGSLNGLELFLGFRVPQSVGENRFGNWLANARDWSISRNRYWGTPIPLWVSSDYEEVLLPFHIDGWNLISCADHRNRFCRGT